MVVVERIVAAVTGTSPTLSSHSWFFWASITRGRHCFLPTRYPTNTLDVTAM